MQLQQFLAHQTLAGEAFLVLLYSIDRQTDHTFSTCLELATPLQGSLLNRDQRRWIGNGEGLRQEIDPLRRSFGRRTPPRQLRTASP